MSNKQLRASINKIQLDKKTKKQAQKTLLKQYEKVGRNVPKKLQEGTATKAEMRKYQQTLLNTLNRRIDKEEVGSSSVQRYLHELNNIQHKRKELIEGKLQGYDENFVKGFLKGKIAVLGRGITYSVFTTKDYTENQIINMAKNNKKSIKDTIKSEIQALKNDSKALKNIDNTNYIYNKIKDYIEMQGYSITNSNKSKILTRLKKIDWLGSQKLIATIQSKINDKFYEIYKEQLQENNNEDLLESIFDDIKKATREKTTMYARLLE